MKAKKALKRLTRVEALLTEVLKQYTAAGTDTKKSIESAQASIAGAREAATHDLARAGAKKQAAKKQAAKQSATKKRVLAAKKRTQTPVVRKRRIAANRKPAVRAPASVPSVPEIAAAAEA